MSKNDVLNKIDIVIYYKNQSIGRHTVEKDDAAFFYKFHKRKENVVDVKMYRHQEVKITDG